MRIVRTSGYAKDLKRMGVTAAETREIEVRIASNPQSGDVIRGLGGIRKIRFAFGGRGKRGGGRAIYFLQVADDAILMLMAYAKNEQEDLSSDQRKVLARLMKEILG